MHIMGNKCYINQALKSRVDMKQFCVEKLLQKGTNNDTLILDAMYQATHIVLQCRCTAWISYSYNTTNFDLLFVLCKEKGEFFWFQVDRIPTASTVVTLSKHCS